MFFRLLIILLTFFSLSNASGTYNGVYFNDYEENASLHLVNYYSYQHFIDMNVYSYYATSIVNNRPYASFSAFVSSGSYAAADLQRIRESSHLIDWSDYTDEMGLTLHDKNFLYGLSGALMGFVFLFGFILIVIRRV